MTLPRAPQIDLLLRKSGVTLLTWKTVVHDELGNRITPSGYKVYRSNNRNLEAYDAVDTIRDLDVTGMIQTIFQEKIEGFYGYGVSALKAFPAQFSPNTLAFFRFQGNGNDETENHNNLTPIGAIPYVSSPVSTGTQAVGPLSDSNFFVGAGAPTLATDFSNLTDWSLEFDIYPTSSAVDGGVVLSTGPGYGVISIVVGSGPTAGKIGIKFTVNGVTVVTGTVDIPEDTAYVTVRLVITPSSTSIFYDGVEKSSVPQTSNLGIIGGIFIGRTGDNGFSLAGCYLGSLRFKTASDFVFPTVDTPAGEDEGVITKAAAIESTGDPDAFK